MFEDRIPKYRTLLLKAILWINIAAFLASMFTVHKAIIISVVLINFALSGTCLLMDKFALVFNSILGANKATRGLNKILKSYG